MDECTCDNPKPGLWNGCSVHVACDDNCKALEDPQTNEELRAALEHWRGHDYMGGCSHAC